MRTCRSPWMQPAPNPHHLLRAVNGMVRRGRRWSCCGSRWRSCRSTRRGWRPLSPSWRPSSRPPAARERRRRGQRWWSASPIRQRCRSSWTNSSASSTTCWPAWAKSLPRWRLCLISWQTTGWRRLVRLPCMPSMRNRPSTQMTKALLPIKKKALPMEAMTVLPMMRSKALLPMVLKMLLPIKARKLPIMSCPTREKAPPMTGKVAWQPIWATMRLPIRVRASLPGRAGPVPTLPIRTLPISVRRQSVMRLRRRVVASTQQGSKMTAATAPVMQTRGRRPHRTLVPSAVSAGTLKP
mmetsp:Transcript_12802/g.38614  ORF Transcript_12802/g.38614 Transcript_12802/m.38614 type:complete len:296 (+) Transcript_12802:492-1379(+)